MNFTEIEIAKLFGSEAAESEDPDRLKEYYVKSNIYSQVITDLPLRILVGHKGTGKSALFQVAMQEELSKKRLAILIKPDDIADLEISDDGPLKLIRSWKIGIMEIIAKKILVSFGKLSELKDWKDRLKDYGGRLFDFISSSNLLLKNENLAEVKRVILENYLSDGRISIYLDDLDRGWQGRENDIRRISALLNAVRDLSTENRNMFFRVSLRSDVYYLSRTSDESTDKTEGAVIWNTWSNHEILVLLVKRIESYFGRPINENELIKQHQSIMMNYLQPVIEDRFTGRGHWENAPMYRVLMSLIRKRPRDLVKLLTLAARRANIDKATKISTRHLEGIFEEYSQGRLQDTINEYRSELPDLKRLILNMKPSKKQKKTSGSYVYTTDELLKKIKTIESQGAFFWQNKSKADTKGLAAFLYKINFITARKKTENGIDRKYFEENRYLSNKFADFGYEWEIHPAYRWALQPDNLFDIFKEVELSID